MGRERGGARLAAFFQRMESIMELICTSQHREPWNNGKLVGQKAPFKLKEIWAIRTRLQMAGRSRDLALFDLGIDSKLQGCDLVELRVRSSSNRKPNDRFSSRSCLPLGKR